MIRYEVRQAIKFDVVENVGDGEVCRQTVINSYDNAEIALAVADALTDKYACHPADSVINEMDEAEAILNDDTPFPGCVPISAMDESGTTVAEANGADKDEFDQFFG